MAGDNRYRNRDQEPGRYRNEDIRSSRNYRSDSRKTSGDSRRSSDYDRNDRRRTADDIRRPSGNTGRRPSGNGGSRKRKNKKKNILTRLIVIILIIILVVVAVLVFADMGKQKPTEQETTIAEETTEAVITAKEITVVAAGDVIGHDTILELSYTGTGYDFRSLFAPLKSDIAAADVAIVNMETPFGGPEVGPYIGYPAFNTPDEMGLALIDTGFDVVQLASNHSMDSGVDGLLHELDFWKQHTGEVLTTGLNESEAAKNQIPIIEKEGIKIAVLNYTYGLNGYEIPAEYSYLVTLLTDDNRDFIRSQIEEAGKQADLVIVCPHWGTEYLLDEPDASQKDWAQLFTEAGADVIIGTHPHVVEKADWIEAGGNKALCYYSLGNYVSNQQDTETVLGVLADFKIRSDENGIYVPEDSAKVVPVVTHNDKTNEPVKIATYYLSDYTEDMAAVHDTKLSFDEEFSIEKMQKIIDDVFDKSWVAASIQ